MVCEEKSYHPSHILLFNHQNELPLGVHPSRHRRCSRLRSHARTFVANHSANPRRDPEVRWWSRRHSAIATSRSLKQTEIGIDRRFDWPLFMISFPRSVWTLPSQ
ncbi:unnamed protein product, partial [Mesorhabditis belari]|uniref:Uncharacterized protein n=1 Tax=Mesorhabditis belari TaxID=2138241 RepID=A0AAF3FSL8_9BILA